MAIDIFDAVYEIEQRNSDTDSRTIHSGREKAVPKPYTEILTIIRNTISKNHADELSGVIASKDSADVLKRLISSYVIKLNLLCEEIGENAELCEKLYEDMAGFSFLTKYLYDASVEEININSWEDIEVEYAGGDVIKIEERFLNPGQCIDIVKKMVALGGLVIDGSEPVQDSYMSQGVRISATISPVNDKEAGASASIRKQKEDSFSAEDMITLGTCTKEEMDFIYLCLTSGISVAFAGGTSSGKTTDLNIFLNLCPDYYRIVTIEEGVRELRLIRRDENGRVYNRVVNWITNPNAKIDSQRLVKASLRYHPHIIVPAEMRGSEALDAQEAARTGHTVATTLHANSATDAYARILSMCEQSGHVSSETRLAKNIVDAFPIIVYKKKMIDGSRKYLSIVEGLSYENNEFVCKSVFQFNNNGIDSNGRISGSHAHVGTVSDKIAERMLENGAPISAIARYASREWLKSKGAV